MDEYVDLPRDHPESYHSFMFKNLFNHIDIDPKNVHIPDGNAPDLVKECQEFEDKMKSFGGVELFIGGVCVGGGGTALCCFQSIDVINCVGLVFLGIGADGHIAFNEPGSSLSSRTRVKTLAQDTINDNARFFGGDLSKVPSQALTVGVGTVMDAKEVCLLLFSIQL